MRNIARTRRCSGTRCLFLVSPLLGSNLTVDLDGIVAEVKRDSVGVCASVFYRVGTNQDVVAPLRGNNTCGQVDHSRVS